MLGGGGGNCGEGDSSTTVRRDKKNLMGAALVVLQEGPCESIPFWMVGQRGTSTITLLLKYCGAKNIWMKKHVPRIRSILPGVPVSRIQV